MPVRQCALPLPSWPSHLRRLALMRGGIVGPAVIHEKCIICQKLGLELGLGLGMLRAKQQGPHAFVSIARMWRHSYPTMLGLRLRVGLWDLSVGSHESLPYQLASLLLPLQVYPRVKVNGW